jgi:hypothetical protein
MTSDLSDFEKAQARTADPRFYRQRPHALSAEVEFEIRSDALAWEDAKGNTGSLLYADIERVRLTYDPARIRQTRHVADLFTKAGGRVRVTSTTFAGMGMYKPRNRAFVAFLDTLHNHLAERSSHIRFETGRGWAPYLAFLAVWVACLGAMLWGTWQFWLADQRAIAVALVLMVAYFGWMAGEYARMNRPGIYDPRAIPRGILPKPTESDV